MAVRGQPVMSAAEPGGYFLRAVGVAVDLVGEVGDR